MVRVVVHDAGCPVVLLLVEVTEVVTTEHFPATTTPMVLLFFSRVSSL